MQLYRSLYIFTHLLCYSCHIYYIHNKHTILVTIFALYSNMYFKEIKRKIVFYIFPHIYYFWYSSFHPANQNFYLVSFPFDLKNLFGNSQTVHLLVMNTFSFPLSENVFISASFFKDIFTAYKILGWDFFFPSAF